MCCVSWQLSPLDGLQDAPLRTAGDFTPSERSRSRSPCLLLTSRTRLSVARVSDGLGCACAKGEGYSSNAWSYFLLVKIRAERVSAAGLSQRVVGCIATIHEALLISLSSIYSYGAVERGPEFLQGVLLKTTLVTIAEGSDPRRIFPALHKPPVPVQSHWVTVVSCCSRFS